MLKKSYDTILISLTKHPVTLLELESDDEVTLKTSAEENESLVIIAVPLPPLIPAVAPGVPFTFGSVPLISTDESHILKGGRTTHRLPLLYLNT